MKIARRQVLGNVKRGLLFVVSAPAGTGKTTLVKQITDNYPQVVQSVSYTTRPRRSNEKEGVDYHFVTQEEFASRIQAGDFYEHVLLYGHHYGTSKSWVDQQLQQGKHVVLVIDTQGFELIDRQEIAASIFICPPAVEALTSRLIQRGSETKETLARRLAIVQEELEKRHQYDYVVVNDQLAVAYEVVKSILIAEEHKQGRYDVYF